MHSDTSLEGGQGPIRRDSSQLLNVSIHLVLRIRRFHPGEGKVGRGIFWVERSLPAGHAKCLGGRVVWVALEFGSLLSCTLPAFCTFFPGLPLNQPLGPFWTGWSPSLFGTRKLFENSIRDDLTSITIEVEEDGYVKIVLFSARIVIRNTKAAYLEVRPEGEDL